MVNGEKGYMTKILGILFIVLLVIFIITLIFMTTSPEQKEKEEVNNVLSSEQMISLLKCTRPHLTHSNDLQVGSITDESMIVFASDYISLDENNSLIYTEEYIIANTSDIEDKVSYIFDKQIDYSKVSFEVKENTIYIPIYLTSSDAQIYKFSNRIYDEVNDIYTVYIDCLEPGPSQYTELSPDNVTSYDKSDVINTLVFKYKIKDERKILLAFDSVINMNN